MKKYLILMVALLYSFASQANEVRTIRGQKVVMFTTHTATMVELTFANGTLSKMEQAEKLKKIFRDETKYCTVVAKTFKPSLEAKCKKLLYGNYFAEDLVSQGFETSEQEGTQVTLSKYFTLLMLY